MVTVSIKLSAKMQCVPLTVNRLLTAVRKENTGAGCFWPRLVKDKSINFGKKVGVKLDLQNLEYLQALKRQIKAVFGIFVSYSMLICALMKLYNKPQEREAVSLNVKGYKAMSKDFARRIAEIAKQIKTVMPDILMLQEFRTGEENKFLNVLMRELGKYYHVVLPASYNQKEDYNSCICITLMGKHMANMRTIHLKHETAGFKLRYNLIQTDDYVYLNAWAPQVINMQQDRFELADKMWKELLDLAQYYSDKMMKFCLAGDLNAFVGGAMEEKILRLNIMLRDTKILEDMSRPTGLVNILDYAFVNRFASQSEMVRTSLLEPSIKQRELSDHDALLMKFTAVS